MTDFSYALKQIHKARSQMSVLKAFLDICSDLPSQERDEFISQYIDPCRGVVSEIDATLTLIEDTVGQ